MSTQFRSVSPKGLLLVGLFFLLISVGFYAVKLAEESPIPKADWAKIEPQVSKQILALRQAVKSASQQPEAWGQLGQAFHAHDLFTQALVCYNQATQLAPKDYRWLYLAGLAQAKSNPEAALSYFVKAVSLIPQNPGFYISYADVLFRSGHIQKAGKLYQKARQLNPKSTYAIYGLAQVAFLMGHIEAAQDLLEGARKIAPLHGELHLLLAQVYQRLGNPESAQLASLRAQAFPSSSRSPDPVIKAMRALAVDAQSIGREGIRLATAGEYAKAEFKFRQVLKIRPGNARDFANLGGALARQNKNIAAIAVYQQGLDIDPDDVDLLSNMGNSLTVNGQYQDAEKTLRHALSIDARATNAHINLGRLQLTQDLLSAAEQSFRTSIEINPALVRAHLELASLLDSQGRHDDALMHWQTLVNINPQDLSSLYGLSISLAKNHQHAAAIDTLRSAMRLAPNSSRLNVALAWQLATAPDAQLRNGQEALALIQRVNTAYPERAEVLNVLAAAKAENKKFKEAALIARHALALAKNAHNRPLTADLIERIQLYELGQAYRQ